MHGYILREKEREIGVTGREVSTRSSKHEKCMQGSDHVCSLSSIITMPNLSAELNLSSASSRRLRFRLSIGVPYAASELRPSRIGSLC